MNYCFFCARFQVKITNLFLSVRSTGLSAELYYVREGQVNEYALHFTVPVPANVQDISFTWQSLAGKPLPYKINIVTSDPLVLPKPSMNISRVGEIPTQIETFAIALKCAGRDPAEVEVTITIEVTLNRATGNATELVFRRKKICLNRYDPICLLINELDILTTKLTFPQ